LVCFVILAVCLLWTSPRLRVYYKIAAARVETTQISPDGIRMTVPVPPRLERAGSIHYSMEQQLALIEKDIRKYMDQAKPLAQTPPETRLQWDIHYSFNNPRMDRQKTLSFSQ